MNIDEATKDAIETVAKAKVAEALGGDVLGKLVDEVMRHKNRTSYGGRQEETFFDLVVRECIEATIRQAIFAELKDNEALKAKLSAAIQERADKFAVSIIDAFASDDWRAEMRVTIQQRE